MQRPIQENISVVQIPALRIVEVKAGEVRLGIDDCILISDPAENCYEDLGTLFASLKRGIEKIGQLYIDCVTIVKPLDDTIGLERYTLKLDSSCKRNLWKSLNPFDTRIKAMKKANIISEERPAGFDCIIDRREIIKSEDYD